MDGAVVNPVPCDQARELGADLVIAVDVTPSVDPLQPMGTSYEVAMRAAEITRSRLKSIQLQRADIVIPVDLTEVFWGDLSRFDHCVDSGREATRQALPAIREALANAPARLELVNQ